MHWEKLWPHCPVAVPPGGGHLLVPVSHPSWAPRACAPLCANIPNWCNSWLSTCQRVNNSEQWPRWKRWLIMWDHRSLDSRLMPFNEHCINHRRLSVIRLVWDQRRNCWQRSTLVQVSVLLLTCHHVRSMCFGGGRWEIGDGVIWWCTTNKQTQHFCRCG